jgi:hypothetical protein
MRENSKKQTAASRKNGGKSPGPTSADGKQKSRLNALKDGNYAKQAVVTAAGERVLDFKRLEAWMWESVKPDGAIEEILTSDAVDSWWGRQSARRGKSAALQNYLVNLQTHDIYLAGDEIEPLMLRFQFSLERYQGMTASTPSGDRHEIVTELESLRSQLASTPRGLEFLIMKVNAVKEQAEWKGQISDASDAVLGACVGLTNDLVRYCRGINLVNKTESAKTAARAQAGQSAGAGQTKATAAQEKAQGDQSQYKGEAAEWNEAEAAARGQARQSAGAGQTKATGQEKAQGDQRQRKAEAAGRYEAEQRRTLLVSSIKSIARQLKHRKQLLEQIEISQDKTRWAAAVLPDDRTYERFERAETTYDRRLYRALEALQARKARQECFRHFALIRRSFGIRSTRGSSFLGKTKIAKRTREAKLRGGGPRGVIPKNGKPAF